MNLRIADIDLVLSGDGIDNLTDIFRQYMLTEAYESSEDKISVNVEVCKDIQAMDPDEVYGVKNDIEEFGICEGRKTEGFGPMALPRQALQETIII